LRHLNGVMLLLFRRRASSSSLDLPITLQLLRCRLTHTASFVPAAERADSTTRTGGLSRPGDAKADARRSLASAIQTYKLSCERSGLWGL